MEGLSDRERREQRAIEAIREEDSHYAAIGQNIVPKLEYIANIFKKDPSLVRYVRGIAGDDATLNPIVFELVVNQVYALCQNLEKTGQVKN